MSKSFLFVRLAHSTTFNSNFVSQQEIEYQFVRASELADQLQNKLKDFSKHRDDLYKRLEEQQKWLLLGRDSLNKLDDVSGSDEELVEKLQRARELTKELETHQAEVALLEDDIKQLDDKYHSPESSGLVKDSTALHKKYDAAVQKAAKVNSVNLNVLVSK